MLRLKADREPFVPVFAAPGVTVGAKGKVQPVHGFPPRGGMPVSTVEAYSHGKAIDVGASQMKAHAAVEHGGEAYFSSSFTIGELHRLEYVHCHTSLVVGQGRTPAGAPQPQLTRTDGRYGGQGERDACARD
ncbi:hypothetical protein BG46_17110 [Brucella anthropi]|nr:hypothetical protein BG46_17110 [Brucella anthropi]